MKYMLDTNVLMHFANDERKQDVKLATTQPFSEVIMHATFQLKSDELNESFLQVIKKQFQNKTIEIAVSDVPDLELAQSPSRKAGALKGRIKMSADFNAPLDDFAEYQP
ncbi:MAG: DUF2281 domain-containing protein [Gallionella sp.]|nr:DUF2281 domain-containing protein [Gallionella sp.]